VKCFSSFGVWLGRKGGAPSYGDLAKATTEAAAAAEAEAVMAVVVEEGVFVRVLWLTKPLMRFQPPPTDLTTGFIPCSKILGQRFMFFTTMSMMDPAGWPSTLKYHQVRDVASQASPAQSGDVHTVYCPREERWPAVPTPVRSTRPMLPEQNREENVSPPRVVSVKPASDRDLGRRAADGMAVGRAFAF
jgi:hypothetical protein